MKKKGLIISTVVMVVVLIASLTTATYAWFTSADAVKIDAINMQVKSSAKVNVGVRFKEGTGYNNYYNGDVEAVGTGNTVSWKAEGASVGLSSTLKFVNLELNSQKAIGTSNYGENWSETNAVDATTNILSPNADNQVNGGKKYIVKAKGAGTKIAYDTVELADANKDYLNATIGVEANEKGVKGTYVMVKVTTTDSNPTMGINASVHFVIRIGDRYVNIEPFGTVANTALKSNVKHTSVPTGNQGYCTYSSETQQVTSVFYFWVAKGNPNTDTGHTGEFLDLGLNGSDISDFIIYAYIDGADTHCVKDATGGCKIEIEFDGTKDVKCETLGDTGLTPITDVKFIEATNNVTA